jgi:phosphatidylglycerophosphatase C
MYSIAIFDLDETISKKDTYLLFLLLVLRKRPWIALRLIMLLPITLLFFLKRISNTQLKQAYLNTFLRDVSFILANKMGEEFAQSIVENGMYQQAIERIEKHRSQGAKLVLATGGINLYADHIGRILKFDSVLSTKAEVDPNERLSGKLDGENLRGPAKLEALRLRFDVFRQSERIIAYSDHVSDLDMLTWADCGVVINASKDLSKMAHKLGLECEDWH